MMELSKAERLKIIRDEVWNLKESPLYEYRVANGYYPVIGEGSHDAKIMFVGEAPGGSEARTGRPFCGPAGKFLDELLESAGIKREAVYITNILKDRPPDNRDPLPEEVALYAQFLNDQIEIIQPEVIVTLGRYSLRYLMEKFGLGDQIKPISQIHGQVFSSQSLFGGVKIITQYHPAAAIHNPNLKETIKKDFQVLKELF